MMATIEVGCNMGKCQGMIRHHLKFIETRIECFKMSDSTCAYICIILLQADEIVITTGYGGSYLNDTELVKIGSNGNIIATPTTCKLPDYPMALDSAKGIFLSELNSNIICGGRDYDKNTATNK